MANTPLRVFAISINQRIAGKTHFLKKLIFIYFKAIIEIHYL